MYSLRLHPEHAPRKRLRGQRRYFRRIHRDAAAFELDVQPDSWWNLWHYHADWRGWGNRGWRYRLEHLRALCRVFQTISGEDAGEDATYLHTPNRHGTPFPTRG